MNNAHIFARNLDTNGTGTGAIEIATNHATATRYQLVPPAGSAYVIHRLIFRLEDTGQMDVNKLGNAVDCTNGISIRVEDASGNTLNQLTDTNMPITTNGEFAAYSYDTRVDTYGSGPEQLSCRWTLAKAGRPLVVDGDDGERLVAHVGPDDLSELDALTINVQGYVINSEDPTPW